MRATDAICAALCLVVGGASCGRKPSAPQELRTPPANAAAAPLDPLPVDIRILRAMVAEATTVPEVRTRAAQRLADALNLVGSPAAVVEARALYRQLAGWLNGEARDDALIRLAQTMSREERPLALGIYHHLLCPARFAARHRSGEAASAGLPQDHSSDYWLSWQARHPFPIDREPLGPSVRAPHDRRSPESAEEETAYTPLYEQCGALPAGASEARRRLHGAVWLDVARLHETEPADAGGPFNLNRAAEAYAKAVRQTAARRSSPTHLLAKLRQAHHFMRQERYRAATEAAVAFLTQLESAPLGPQGIKLLADHAVYVLAVSLPRIDFEGSPAAHPYIARTTVYDEEGDRAVLQRRIRKPLERLFDDAVLPQRRWWTAGVYLAVAADLRQNLFHELEREVMSTFIDRFPMHRAAPYAQHRVLSILRSEMALSAPLPPLAAQQAIERQRAQLIERFGASSPWAKHHAGDEQALHRAARIVADAVQSRP